MGWQVLPFPELKGFRGTLIWDPNPGEKSTLKKSRGAHREFPSA